jgi:hypothetical protein
MFTSLFAFFLTAKNAKYRKEYAKRRHEGENLFLLSYSLKQWYEKSHPRFYIYFTSVYSSIRTEEKNSYSFC